ncbi:MAG: hypothetical protein ABH860_05355 [bacterium]
MLLIMLFLPLGAFCATGTIDSSYSYDYTQPPEFQPSLNSQFTALSGSVTDIYANPAGIMHINTLEVAVGVSGFVQNPVKSDDNIVYVDDTNMGGIENSPNSRTYLRLTDDRAVITPEARPITINENYSKGGGVNFFGITYRMSDWLAFSISRKRTTAITFDYQLLAPLLLDARADFRGTSFEAGGTGDYIQIRNDGTVEVVIGGVTMGTSEVSAWSGFLTQGTGEVNWLSGTFDNTIINNNGIVFSAAAKTGQVSWGINIMPMTYDLELNNEVTVTSDSNNSNLKFYLPDLDFSSTFEALSWITSECSQQSGYRTVEVETLTGKELGSAKIAGKYSASFTRMDFGMQWNPNDFFSMGAVYENFNSATLDLKGVNVIQYVKHRVDTTSRMPTLESESYWNPFLGTPTYEVTTHEVDTEETIRNTLTMHPIELPRKIKIGAAFKKPLLFAVDWEQWLNEYQYTKDPGHPETAHYITLSNISFIKFGGETRLLFLPVMMRGSLTGMFKPTSDDAATQNSIDDLYSTLPIVPVDGNLYFGFNIMDGEFGFGFGGGGLPLMQAVMLDMSSIMKIFYTNIYYTKGIWQVSYLMTMDPVLTGFESDISTTAGQTSELRLMSTSTLGIGVKF